MLLARPRPNINEFAPPPRNDSPAVSVIVPARNEAHNIGRCLRSLLASEYPEFEVIMVDDGSTDETGAIARRLAQEDERLVVVTGAAKPDDWAGKPWACWQGYQKAVGELLLFTDADTEHGPKLLGHAVGMLQSHKADLVTVMPLQEMKTFWERQVQPFFLLLLGLRYGSPRRMSRNTNPRDAIANGQFILVTRDSYQWIGGHRKVQASVIEDLQLAAAYTDNGKVLRFALADEDMRTRMYRSLPELVEGWSKNVYIGMMHTMKTPLLTALAMLGAMAAQATWFLLPLLVALWAATGPNLAVIVAGTTAYAGCVLLLGAVLRSAKEHPLWALFYPCGAVMQQRILARALLRGTRRIEWKGRTYGSVEALKQQ